MAELVGTLGQSPRVPARAASPLAQAVAERRWLVGLPVAVTATTLLLLAAGGSDYWQYVATEGTPLNWVLTVLLLASAAAAGAIARVAGRPDARTWALLASGFALLAADEKLAIHEKVGYDVLAGTGIGLPWGHAGDVVLLGVVAAGLAVLPRVVRVLNRDPGSRRLFLVGVGLAALAVAVDAGHPEGLSLGLTRLLWTVEELIEAAAGTLLLLALGLRLLRERPRSLSRPS